MARHHDHIVCMDCGLVEEFVDPEIESTPERDRPAPGLQIEEHSLVLYGRCQRPDCPRKQSGVRVADLPS